MTWALTHHYHLTADGELYAFQALARIHPALGSDVYLASTSQDRYTLFSTLYARVILRFGLLNGSAILFAACTGTFFAAAWVTARHLWGERIAWLSAAMLVVTVAGYGAYGVFHCAENYLTARSMAEALIVLSLAARYRGSVNVSWAIAVLALFIHPLMAVPGLLLLACLSAPWRLSLLGASIGMSLAVALELVMAMLSPGGGPFSIMDPQWLEVVRERSQFLFLKYWRVSDWEMHARILLCLAICFLSTDDERVRRLCSAASLVGVTGVIIGLIAGCMGPVAILLQGQAWRWFWVTGFVSVLVSLPTALRLWKNGGCGSACSILLIASWTFNPINGIYMAACAVCLWSLRNQIGPPMQRVLGVFAFALIAVILASVGADIWSVCVTHPATMSADPIVIERIRSIYGLPIAALAVFGIVWKSLAGVGYWRNTSSAVAAVTLIVCAFVIPDSFSRSTPIGTRADYDAFADWRAKIPPTSNVLLVPPRNSAGFIWFSLQRPSYISVNQSAGVVFSPVTSQEIRRRAKNLLPLTEPDWKLLSQNTRGAPPDRAHPLTPELLRAICADPQLGFIVAEPNLGFGALTYAQPGEWKGWNLYDCREVRRPDRPA
jgi:hypothetical protein